MFVAPAARRRSPRPHPGDRPRQACAAGLSAVPEARFRHVRDGLRWHLIEKAPGKYDWSSWLPALEAAEQAGIQVIWDLFHYGSPDHVDQAGEDFPARFTDFAFGGGRGAAIGEPAPAARLSAERNQFPVVGGRGRLFPARRAGRAGWFKRQLVRAAISAAKAIRERWPDATLVWAEPLVHVAPRTIAAERSARRRGPAQGKFEAYDWIIGPGRARTWRRPFAGRRDRAQFLPAQPMVLRRPDDPDGPPRISAAGRHAGRGGRALRQADVPVRNRRRRIGAGRPGCIMSATRCARRWTAAPRSKAFAGTRSPLIPAGTIAGTPRPGCCRRSSPTAAATSTSACSRNSRRSERDSASRRKSAVAAAAALGHRRGLRTPPTAFRRTASHRAIRCGRSAGSGGC